MPTQMSQLTIISEQVTKGNFQYGSKWLNWMQRCNSTERHWQIKILLSVSNWAVELKYDILHWHVIKYPHVSKGDKAPKTTTFAGIIITYKLVKCRYLSSWCISEQVSMLDRLPFYLIGRQISFALLSWDGSRSQQPIKRNYPRMNELNLTSEAITGSLHPYHPFNQVAICGEGNLNKKHCVHSKIKILLFA